MKVQRWVISTVALSIIAGIVLGMVVYHTVIGDRFACEQQCTKTHTARPVPSWQQRKAQDVSLVGSRAALLRAYTRAQKAHLFFVQSRAQIRHTQGLVRVKETADLVLSRVSHPYALSTTRTFAERLAQQYRAACRERLVVTSLLRPRSEQPPNASDVSVHPAGMALDLRIPQTAACRVWLERTLLLLERRNVIEVTRERRPAHYHVAVFPREYGAYVAYQTTRRQ